MKHNKRIGVFSLLVAFVFLFSITTGSILPTNIKLAMALDGTTSGVTDIALTPGSDPSQLNFAWYSDNTTTASAVQIALKSDMSGTTFPNDKATTFKGSNAVANDGLISNKVTASGFKESTAYIYRLGDGSNWSSVYNYTTKSTSQYSVLVAGDPQIGASGNIASDSTGWVDTMNKATQKFPNASFLLSVGDQVNNGGELNGASNESEYTGFLRPTQFTSLPIAAIAGNHETYGDGHTYHFNLPNMSTNYGIVPGSGTIKGTTGGDYYFTYGNTLYMMLNSNNVSEEGHDAFMQSAIAANPNATWKVVSLHHSIYSSATHETDADIIARRNTLPAIFDNLGIDVVLDGHDHCYTRTYQMKGGVAQTNTNVDTNGNVLNPTGTLYMTFNSASGSKYYDMQSPDRNYYEAVKAQIHVPTFSVMNITNNNLTITTYRTDTMEITDTYTIAKGNIVTPPSDKDFTVKSTFNLSSLVPGKLLDVQTAVTNNKSILQSVLAMVTLYDGNNKMVNMSYISKNITIGNTENLSAGFMLPADTTNYKVKVLVWDGANLTSSTMQPLSNAVILGNTVTP